MEEQFRKGCTLRMSIAFRLFAVAIALFGLSCGAEAAEIKMLASNAVKEAYLHLVPQFEKQTGHTVKIDWLGTNDIIQRVGGGEVTDIAIAPSYVVDDLIKQEKLATGSRVDVARSIIG